MSIKPNRLLLDALRAALSKAETEPGPETACRAELKRILRARIADLEAIAHLVAAR